MEFYIWLAQVGSVVQRGDEYHYSIEEESDAKVNIKLQNYDCSWKHVPA